MSVAETRASTRMSRKSRRVSLDEDENEVFEAPAEEDMEEEDIARIPVTESVIALTAATEVSRHRKIRGFPMPLWLLTLWLLTVPSCSK